MRVDTVRGYGWNSPEAVRAIYINGRYDRCNGRTKCKHCAYILNSDLKSIMQIHIDIAVLKAAVWSHSFVGS